MTSKDSTKAKDEWLLFALKVLMEHGPEQIKIGPLCEMKGVTKGSFYHHFKNRAVFVDELMQYWYNTMTLGFIEQANTQASPMERLEKLDEVIAQHHIGAETHIRAWALKEPAIKAYLLKIDSKRQHYLASCYSELGVPEAMANDLALMAYANFLGMQQICPPPDMATILRISSLGTKTFLQQFNQPNQSG